MNNAIIYSNVHPIRVELNGEEVKFVGAFRFKDMAKRAGFRWNPENKSWLMAKDQFKYRSTEVALACCLDVDSLRDWKQGKTEEREFTSTHPLLSQGLKQLKIEPYGFQKDGINYGLTYPYTVIGSEMGLGKSLQAIGVMVASGLRTVVCCPAFLKQNWEREVKKFSHLSVTVIKKGADAVKLKELTSNVYIVNYEILKHCEHIFKASGMFVFDEAHALKTVDSQRSENARNFISKYPPSRCLFLTGTAITNSVSEFYHLLSLCSMGPNCGLRIQDNLQYSSEYRFARFFSFEVAGDYGSKFEGLKNYPVLRELLKRKYVRHSVKENLPGLPGLVRQKVLYEQIDPGSLSQIDILYKEAIDAKEKGDNSHISRAKAFAALIKVPGTLELIGSLLDNGEQVVVFSDHVESTKQIMEALTRRKVKCAFVTGAVAVDKRQAEVDKFQSGQARVFVATIGAASTGLTLTASRYLVFNDLPWVPSSYLQAEKRCQRIGQKRNCFSYIVTATGLDEAIIAQLLKKVDVLTKVLSDGREDKVEFDDFSGIASSKLEELF